MSHYFLQPKCSRPDYRLVITFLWGDFHNVDTDGDSYNPASRDWTELYCQNREQENEIFEVFPVSHAPLTLKITSDLPEIAARVAYFLALETESPVATDIGGPWHDATWLRQTFGDFDLNAAESRSRTSCWRKSTLENPYPNLKSS